MNLKLLPETFTVCKVEDESQIEFTGTYCFVGKTEDEISWFVPLPTFLVLPKREKTVGVVLRSKGSLTFP